jgi:CHASE2 domain-containing sensor protein
MRPRTTRLYMVVGLAAVLFVAVSAVVQAIGEGSWSPLISVSWLLAVVAAIWPRTARYCLPRRRQAR